MTTSADLEPTELERIAVDVAARTGYHYEGDDAFSNFMRPILDSALSKAREKALRNKRQGGYVASRDWLTGGGF